MINWIKLLFTKKIFNNCIHIDASEGKHIIYLFTDKRIGSKEALLLNDTLKNTDKIKYKIICDLPIQKILHIREK